MFKMASLNENVTMISPTSATIAPEDDADALWRKLAKQKKHTYV
jgi:hypothetical protein